MVTTRTTGNIRGTQLVSPGHEVAGSSRPGAAAHAVIRDQLAAAVEPLLLAKDVGGHRLPSAAL
jgi:hypothetical protein